MADSGSPPPAPGAGPAGARRASYREGLAYAGLTFLMRALMGVGGSIAVARVYGIDVIGQYALATAPGMSLGLLSTVGEQAALVRQLSALPPRAPRVTGLFTAVLAFSFALTLVVALIILGITWYLYQGPIGQPGLIAPAAVYILSYVLLDNTTWNFDTVYSSFRAGRELFQIRTTYTIVFPVLLVVGGLVRSTVWVIVGASIAASFVTLVHRIAVAPRFMVGRVPRHEVMEGFRALPGLIVFGLKVAPGRFADGISGQIGTWLLGAFSSVSLVGAWNRANNLNRRLLEAGSRITEMLLPTIVERDAKGDATGSDRSLVDSLRYSTVGMLLLAAATGGAAVPAMNLFGAGFEKAAPALAILMLVPAQATAQALLGTSLVARDRPGLSTMISLLRVAATVVFSIPLAYYFGLTGAAIAVVVGLGVALAAMVPAVARELEGSFLELWPLRQFAALAIAYAAGLVSAYLVTRVVPGLLGLIPALCVGAIAFLAAFILCGGVDQRDRDRVASIRGKLQNRRTARPAGTP